MIDIGLAGAFLGGLFALVSPCSALLLPSFFAYAFGGVGKLVARTGLFYVGLALVLIPLGAGVGALGTLVTQYRGRSEEHTSELQSRGHLVCRLLLEQKKL